MNGDYEKSDMNQIIVLSNINKVKEQSFKRKKDQSVMGVIPSGWIKDNYPQNSKSGKFSFHRVEIHGEDCLVIRRVK